MKLLVDMNLSPRWLPLLIEAGHAAVHWATVGAVDATDAAIMAHARQHDFVILTHDLDFSAILAASDDSKPSVVQVRCEDARPESVGRLVLDALAQAERDLIEGALVTIDAGRTRLRILPLRTS